MNQNNLEEKEVKILRKWLFLIRVGLFFSVIALLSLVVISAIFRMNEASEQDKIILFCILGTIMLLSISFSIFSYIVFRIKIKEIKK